MSQSQTRRTGLPSAGLALVVVAAFFGALVSACDTSTTPTTSPPASAVASPTAATPSPSAAGTPSSTPTPTATPAPTAIPVAVFAPGSLAVTVSDRLRVRSQPRVADDSAKLAPVLPTGTPLLVIGGPVEDSGYTWYHVAPQGITLTGGGQDGWVAAADHDGTPWIAAAPADAGPGFKLAVATASRAPFSLAAARAAATSNNAFGIDLYRRLIASGDLRSQSIVISPYSVMTALAMARAGALGRTAAQMDAMLHTSGWGRLGAGLNSLDQLLARHNATWKNWEDPSRPHRLDLRTANMVFGQQDFPITQAFLDRLSRTFGAGLGLVDYITATEAARTAINAWVSRHTLGRIPTLLNPPDVTADTRLVLVNAVYLKAEWSWPFDKELTKARAFTTSTGKTLSVPTMLQQSTNWMPYATGPGWTATDLPLAGPDGTSQLSLTLVLPDKLGTFEQSLTPAALASIDARLDAERTRLERLSYGPAGPSEGDCGTYAYSVELYLPRFGIETRANLVPALGAMGMADALSPQADFSGMTSADRLHIGAVIHQANIDVDEDGVTAAAATAVGMDTTGGCGQPEPRVVKTLRFNRPFIYLLRDTGTGAILFMGRVLAPIVRN
ncbi:MAG: serpin family protein [Chloroflexota bacterium]